MNTRGYGHTPAQALASRRRHVVKHDYHDHAFENDDSNSKKKQRRGPRGGVTTPFPVKLHAVLEDNMHDEVISWQPHGRCFVLRKPKEFLDEVMTKYFKQTKLTSFQRQLNLYGFNRLTSGPDKGGYYHELFLRGKPQLSTRMVRMRIKGTRIKAASNPDSEPNFYAMPPLSNLSCSPDMDGNETDETTDRFIKTEEFSTTPKFKNGSAYIFHHRSPVCVSVPCSVSSSNSRSSSRCSDATLGLPRIPSLPISMDHMKSNNFHAHLTATAVHSMNCQYYPDQHGSSSLHDISKFPDPLADDALTFEGKEFHYLDSMSFSFDEDIGTSLDPHVTISSSTGLTVDMDGKFCGFDF